MCPEEMSIYANVSKLLESLRPESRSSWSGWQNFVWICIDWKLRSFAGKSVDVFSCSCLLPLKFVICTKNVLQTLHFNFQKLEREEFCTVNCYCVCVLIKHGSEAPPIKKKNFFVILYNFIHDTLFWQTCPGGAE